MTVGRSRNLFLLPTPPDADAPLLAPAETSFPLSAAALLAVLGKRKQNPRSLAPPRRHPRPKPLKLDLLIIKTIFS